MRRPKKILFKGRFLRWETRHLNKRELRHWMKRVGSADLFNASVMDVRVDELGILDLLRGTERIARNLAMAQERQILKAILNG